MRILTVILIALMLTACGGQTASPEQANADSLVLRTYAVPAGEAEGLFFAIDNLLSGNSEKSAALGHVTVLSPSRIAVLAPEAMQPAIANLIETVAKNSDTTPAEIRFHYWLVAVRSADRVRIPANLEAIGTALKAVTDNLGPVAFSRIAYATHVLKSGSQSTIQARRLYVIVSATARDDAVAAEFEFSARKISKYVSTAVTLRTGQTIVLALMGARPATPVAKTGMDPKQPGGEAGQGRFLAFVVRAEIL